MKNSSLLSRNNKNNISDVKFLHCVLFVSIAMRFFFFFFSFEKQTNM